MRTVMAGVVVVGNFIIFVAGAAVDLTGASLTPTGIPQSAKGWSQCTIFSSVYQLCFFCISSVSGHEEPCFFSH